MDRTRALMAAGGMTGLVLATLLALGFAPNGQATATGSRLPSSTLTTTLEGTRSPDDKSALLEQNRQLKEALELMQMREGQYREQIEQANLALQETRPPAAANSSDDYKYDGDEDDGDEDDSGSHDKDEDKHGHEERNAGKEDERDEHDD